MDRRRINRTIEYLRMLDLDVGAGIAEVREAYRIQSRNWNPSNTAYDNRIKAATERRHAEVVQAYDWLKSNSDAVGLLSREAGPHRTQPPVSANNDSFLSPLMKLLRLDHLPSQVVRTGFLYAILILVLVFGVVFIGASQPGSWLGPLARL